MRLIQAQFHYPPPYIDHLRKEDAVGNLEYSINAIEETLRKCAVNWWKCADDCYDGRIIRYVEIPPQWDYIGLVQYLDEQFKKRYKKIILHKIWSVQIWSKAARPDELNVLLDKWGFEETGFIDPYEVNYVS